MACYSAAILAPSQSGSVELLLPIVKNDKRQVNKQFRKFEE